MPRRCSLPAADEREKVLRRRKRAMGASRHGVAGERCLCAERFVSWMWLCGCAHGSEHAERPDRVRADQTLSAGCWRRLWSLVRVLVPWNRHEKQKVSSGPPLVVPQLATPNPRLGAIRPRSLPLCLLRLDGETRTNVPCPQQPHGPWIMNSLTRSARRKRHAPPLRWSQPVPHASDSDRGPADRV